MKIKVLRAILDTETDVIRDIAIREHATLFDLHKILVEAFELNSGEMSSFFRSNDDWEQGEEISMMDFDAETRQNAQEKYKLSEVFPSEKSKMLFAYDYMSLWTFYIENIKEKKGNSNEKYPKILSEIGTRPSDPPTREMKALNLETFSEDFENQDNDDYLNEDGDDWY